MSEAYECWVRVCETVQKWFGKDASNIIQEMTYCRITEAWVFEYEAPFDPTKQVTYYISKWDGNIDFF